MESLLELIRSAIENTMLTKVEHLAGIFKQRNPGQDAAGSFWDTRQTPQSILDACNGIKEIDVGAAKFGDCRYFTIPVPGTIGVVSLSELKNDTVVTLLDPKNTIGTPGGGVEAYLPVSAVTFNTLSKVDYTTIIVGFDQGKPIIFTMHPGPVFPRSAAQNNAVLVGKKVSVKEAKEIGFVLAKLQVE